MLWKHTQKLTTFFKRKSDSTNEASKSVSPPKKQRKTVSCPGFYYGNNSDLVPLYAKYKKKDEMSDSIKIVEDMKLFQPKWHKFKWIER